MSRPIAGTLAESYLLARGISALQETTCLHFHPSCYYRPDPHLPPEAWPALIAAVTAPSGIITGVHRTWLDPSSAGKAPVDTRRRAMGNLLGNRSAHLIGSAPGLQVGDRMVSSSDR
jgi:hypothetical protein